MHCHCTLLESLKSSQVSDFKRPSKGRAWTMFLLRKLGAESIVRARQSGSQSRVCGCLGDRSSHMRLLSPTSHRQSLTVLFQMTPPPPPIDASILCDAGDQTHGVTKVLYCWDTFQSPCYVGLVMCTILVKCSRFSCL